MFHLFCAFTLANRGYNLRLIQDYLGDREPKYTAHYTRVAAKHLTEFEQLMQ